MFGFICAIVSGIAMTLQGVFNTRLEGKIGTWETSTIVQGTGLILALIILFFAGKGDFKNIKDVNKLYLTGGILGVIIIFTVMKSISTLGTTIGIGTILVAQLFSAAIVDWFGFFSSQRAPFSLHQIIGIAIMIGGIVLFKWKF